MPELPEVEALRGVLAEACVGRTIARVDLTAISALKTFVLPLSSLHGLEVDAVERRGKFLGLSAGGLCGLIGSQRTADVAGLRCF